MHIYLEKTISFTPHCISSLLFQKKIIKNIYGKF